MSALQGRVDSLFSCEAPGSLAPNPCGSIVLFAGLVYIFLITFEDEDNRIQKYLQLESFREREDTKE